MPAISLRTGLATTLSAFVVERRGLVAGRRVLELGCGRGLCGLVAAQCGAASVVLTDYEPAVLALARKNVEANAVIRTIIAGIWVAFFQECQQ